MLHIEELRRKDRTDGACIDGAVSMSTSLTVDGAGVEASSAADAVKRLTRLWVSKNAGAAVVQQDNVEVLRPIAFAYSSPERVIGIHPLAGCGARQKLQEDLEIAKGGND